MPSCPASFVGGGSPPALHTPSKVYVEGLEYISSGLIQQVRNHTLILRVSEQLPELLHRDAVVDCRCHESCRFAASVFIVFLPFLPLPCVHDKCVCVSDHSGSRPAQPTARPRSRPLKKPGDDENWQFYFFTVIRRRFIVWVLIVGLFSTTCPLQPGTSSMFSCSDPADAVSRLAAASSQKVFCRRGEMPLVAETRRRMCS